MLKYRGLEKNEHVQTILIAVTANERPSEHSISCKIFSATARQPAHFKVDKEDLRKKILQFSS